MPNEDDDDFEIGDNTAAKLTGIVTRIEAINEEIAELREDAKHIYEEAASAGFDKKVLRAVIARRAKERAELEEFDALLATYEKAINA